MSSILNSTSSTGMAANGYIVAGPATGSCRALPASEAARLTEAGDTLHSNVALIGW